MRFQHVCFLVLGIISSCAPKATVEPEASIIHQEPEYLFTIGNDPVFAEEFLHTLSKNQHLRSNKQEKLTREEFEQNFDLFINYKLKVKEAEKRGMDQTEEFKNEFKIINEDLKKPYLLKNSIQEGELRKAYSRMQEIVKASHILIQFPSNASQADSLAVFRMVMSLKEKAENGADFNELALEYSDDPSAESNRGDLGYFTALQMVQPFEDAAFGLSVGQISEPVLTDYGYHIIKLEDRRPNPGEIRVFHILVRTDPADTLSEERAKRRIAEAYTALQNNESWEEVTQAFSEDEGTKGTGGKLPWFGVGAIVPEFEKVAFSLKTVGEISAPVKTIYGFHIIRLEEVKPVASFEDMEATLRSKLLRDSRSTLIQSQVTAMQKARYGFAEMEGIIRKLEPIVNNNLGVGTEELFNGLLAENLLDSTLMVIEESPISVGDFFEFIKEDKEIVKMSAGNYFAPWYEKFKEVSLNYKEENDLLSNNKEYRRLTQEYREGILLFSLMNDLVWQKALMDSLGQVEYYETHLDRYQWPERVKALIVKMAANEQAPKVRRFLADKSYQKNLTPKLEDQFLNDFPQLFTVEEDLYVIEEHALLKEIDTSKPKHEVVHQGNIHFILLGESVPKGPKKFEETRGKVIQDYQKHLDSQLVNTLKENYSIQINEGEKERISQIVVKE
jgi:peptidyl-prolyl cis-trans isomerase SurA